MDRVLLLERDSDRNGSDLGWTVAISGLSADKSVIVLHCCALYRQLLYRSKYSLLKDLQTNRKLPESEQGT